MSFGCGRSVIDFLDRCADYWAGNSLTIVGSFLNFRPRVPVCPSWAETIDRPCVTIVFSQYDFEVFRNAFRSTQAKPNHFDLFMGTDTRPRFAPYLLDFYPRFAPRANRAGPHCLIPLDDLGDFALEVDSVFEQAIEKSLTVSSVGFDVYVVKRSIAEHKVRIGATEQFLWMKLDQRRARHYQRSIFRAREYCFARFCRKIVRPSSATLPGITTTVHELLKNSLETQSLTLPLFAELLNRLPVPDIPMSISRRFRQPLKSYRERAWNGMIDWHGLKFLVDLAPTLTRRKDAQWGNIFLLFNQILDAVKQICSRCGPPEPREGNF
jgi:hypothetical protein